MKTKIYKVLSIMLTLAVILSTCLCAMGTVSAASATYYLSADGSDTNAGTSDAPLQTLAGALTKALADANAGGYNSPENTVYLKLLDPYDASNEKLIDCSGINDIDFDFTLNISSSEGKAALNFAVASVNDSRFNGPVVFDNVYFNIGSSSRYTEFYVCGNNATFTGTEFWIGSKPDLFNTAGCAGKTTVTYDAPQKVIYSDSGKKPWTSYVIGGCQGTVYDEDFTLEYNAPNVVQKISLGATTNGYGVTFNKLLNLNIKGSSGITLAESKNGVTFGENAAVQIINSSGYSVDTTAIKSKLVSTPAYILNDNTKVADLLKFTETAGTFATDTVTYDVVATDADGNEYFAKNGYLTVPAGEYEISVFKPAKQVTYYISVDGDDADAGTKEAPFKTLAGALTKATEAAVAGDYNYENSTVYLKLLDAYDASNEKLVESTGIADIDFDYTLKISSEEGKAVLGTMAVNGSIMDFKGPVVFENIIYNVGTSSKYSETYFNGNNVTIGEGVEFWGPHKISFFNTTGASGATAVYENAQTVVYNDSGSNAWSNYIIGGCESTTYNSDFSLSYNAPNVSQTIYLGASKTGCGVTFNANLNLDFAGSKGITLASMKNGVTFGKNAAVQIVNSTGNTVDYSAFATEFATVPNYVFTNNTEYKDILEFTEEAGTYKIDGSKYTVIATPVAGGDAIESVGNYLTVPAGEYNLTADAPAVEVTYYVSISGDDTAKGTLDAPLKTVGGAVTKALADATAGGYNASKNTITIKLIDAYNNNDANIFEWGTISDIDYNFKLYITSYGGKAIIGNPVAGANVLDFEGDVTFENVILNVGSSSRWTEIYLNTNNVTFGENMEYYGPHQLSMLHTAGSSGTTAEYSTAQNVVYNSTGSRAWSGFILGGCETAVYNAPLTLTYNAPNVAQTIGIGASKNNCGITVNSLLNLDIRGNGGLTISESKNGVTFGEDAAFQIINTSGTDIDYSALSTKLENVPTYVITDKTGVENLLTFTETAGTYTVDTKKYNVVATPVDGGNAVNAADGKLVLTAGEYMISVQEAASDNYKDFITDRGTGLKNTYAKLSAGETVNVVYYGGSITAGQGASDPETTSYRALIGNWLASSFPQANVVNHNYTYGGTGSRFGAYRLREEVFAGIEAANADIDLMFIEFAINDMYAGLNDANAKTYFESIVRGVRTKYPECDIVAVYTTNESSLRTDSLSGKAVCHDEIAAVYGIPAIAVGRSIATEIQNTGNSWGYYAGDSVHPNDNGYAVYFNTIKEYFNNNLIHGSYDGTVTAHTMPAQVMPSIVGDNVKFVDITADSLAASEALGGQGFVYGDNSSIFKNCFAGGMSANRSDTVSAKYVVEFIGTELLVVQHRNNILSYRLTVDGGTPYTVDCIGVSILPLISGLEDKYHEVVIEPVYSETSDTAYLYHMGYFTRSDIDPNHEHSYTADCDVDCNVCYKPRNAVDHKYSTYTPNDDAACGKNETESATCDYGCGTPDTRDIADTALDHVFDHACDTDCNREGCNHTRETTHVYDGPTDLECNTVGCGYTRPLGAQIVEEGGKYYYYYDGVKSTATALVDYEGKKIYVKAGEWTKETNLVKVSGVWYYINEGVWDTSIDTLHKINGKWFLIKGGIWKATTGLVEYKGKTFYVKGGKWTSGVTALKKLDGKWYYIKNGKWDNTVESLHKINGKWFLIKDGMWKATTGLVKYSGKYFYVKGGKWSSSVNTLYKKSGKWFAIKSGKWYTSKAIISYNGKKFYCNKGYAQLKYSGKVTVNKKTYTIKKGVVK